MSSDFKNYFRDLLQKAGLSQDELAQKFNVSLGTVNSWANGKRFPCEANIEQMCSIFDVSYFDIWSKLWSRKEWQAFEDELQKRKLEQL